MGIVTVHALDAGHITLPERFFVTPHDPTASRYTPSLSFLIQHTDTSTNEKTRILFDLGLRRDLSLYPPALQEHCQSRSPTSTRPDVVESLTRGGLTPNDIDYVILSHMHYDHIGYPKDFSNPKTKFIIGPGARSVLTGQVSFPGTHSVFEPDLLPTERSIELPPVEASWDYTRDPQLGSCSLELSQWTTGLPPFPPVMDIFGDSSVYIINAPGHLPGHVNVLCQLSPQSSSSSTTTQASTSAESTESKYVLLAGDSCHDSRLFQGTHSMATWQDQEGKTCCIHADIAAAQQTLKTLKQVHDHGIGIVEHDQPSDTMGTGTGKFMTIGDQTIEIQKGWFGDPRAQDPGRMDPPATTGVKKHANVEVVFAHDEVWEQDAKDRNRFWPGQL